MSQIKFEDLPDKMTEVLENQQKIINMLMESPSNRREQYITRKEVKRMLSVNSDVTIIEMERQGTLTPYRIGKRVLYKVGEVENALKSFNRK
jgi:hypothetical protein